MKKFKVLAFDLDGTLTQHKTPLGEENRSLLDTLRESYHLLMVGAGQCYRIYHQMGEYPIDIIGNYGMQFSRYEINKGMLVNIYDEHVPCNKEDVTKRIDALRQKQGFTSYSGESVEFHSSGCVTYPLLGTTADLSAKLVPPSIYHHFHMISTMLLTAMQKKTDFAMTTFSMSGTIMDLAEMTNQYTAPIFPSSA